MAMISLNMTLEEKQATAVEALGILHSVEPDAFIAGGYPRDILMGGKPKDIDIFIHLSADREGREYEIAERVFEAFGQVCLSSIDPEQPNAYANIVQNHRFKAFRMIATDRSWEPVNIIFTSCRTLHELFRTFDWTACMASVGERGAVMLDEGPCFLNVTHPLMDIPSFINHTKRLKEKYPDLKLYLPTTWASNRPDVYQALSEEGLLGEERQTIQAQGEAPAGDEVGLGAGEAGRFEARWITPRDIREFRPRAANTITIAFDDFFRVADEQAELNYQRNLF